jgi:hypothetical protein
MNLSIGYNLMELTKIHTLEYLNFFLILKKMIF